MKTKKAAAIPFQPLQTAMLTEEELINVNPQFENLTPEEKAKMIEFVYEFSLVLYNSVGGQSRKDG